MQRSVAVVQGEDLLSMQMIRYGIPAPRYRMPDSTRLGRVRLQVANLDRSLSYYTDVLGFRVLTRGNGYALLAAYGDNTPLVELHEQSGATPAPLRGRLGLYHFAILLPNRAALGRFVTHLGAVGAQVGSSDHLVSEALYLRDPDGLGIEIYADRLREEWQTEDQQLVMDTKPLDLADLARAASNTPWAGMPAGTVVGHVHLHVGDIPEAAAFFHAALGLDQTVWSYPGALFLSAGGYHHHLGVNTWAGPTANRPADTDARLLEWEILVPQPDDAEAAARNLESAGYEVIRSANGWVADDPWGTRLRVTPSLPNEHSR